MEILYSEHHQKRGALELKKQHLLPLLAVMYLLGNHRGYLALWKEDHSDPWQIYPVKVESLPESDQKALAQGIPARSEIELSSLLEDFLS